MVSFVYGRVLVCASVLFHSLVNPMFQTSKGVFDYTNSEGD